jgi:hypothetical protein
LKKMSTTDCEKFEPLLLDELYEELDELTSAALKRHVSGCARCKSSLDAMRATRRLVSLPMVDVPEGLEDRIFAAAKEAQKVVPIKGRFSRVLSAAGSWAMRPQTAMAAVFLLMIGSSAFLLRSNAKRASDSQMSVTVAGAPQVAASAASESDRLDDKSASQAHGPITLPPAAAPAPAASVAMNDESGSTIDRLAAAAAAGDKAKDNNALGAMGADQPAAKGESEKKVATGRAAPADPMSNALSGNSYGGGPTNAAAPAGAPYGGAAQGAGGSADGYTQQTQALAPAKRSGNEAADPFSAGTAAYRARNYAEATKQFDAAAANGDQNAALWAAKSTKDGQGCATALGRFENVAKNAAGTWTGHEASLEAARCQIAMGNLDPARDRLNKLAQVPSHSTPAKAALDELNAVAARRQAGTVGGGAHASKAPAPPAKAAPASAPKAAPAPRDNASSAGF